MGDLIWREDALKAIEEMQMPIMRSMIDRDQFVFKGLGMALEAVKAISSANVHDSTKDAGWIPVKDRLPENRVCVIVCYREWQQYVKRFIYSIVIGWYARKNSVTENVFSEWEMDTDYDEEDDECYIKEGWYEWTTQGNGDLMNWYINAEVIAWMPLPEPYKEENFAVEQK